MTEQQPPSNQDVPPDYTAPVGPDDDSGFIDVVPEPETRPEPPQPVTEQPKER
jgi:hypothetical protein